MAKTYSPIVTGTGQDGFVCVAYQRVAPATLSVTRP